MFVLEAINIDGLQRSIIKIEEKRDFLMLKIKYLGLLLIFLGIIALGGCNTQEPSETSSPIKTPEEFVSPLVSPLLVPSPIVPTPGADVCAIAGRLVSTITGEPLPGRTVVLGTLLSLDPEGYLIVVPEQNGIRAITDEYGYFSFNDLLPDTYALVLWSPVSSQVIPDPATDAELLVTLKAGELKSLGSLFVAAP